MEKKSANHSDRPRMILISELSVFFTQCIPPLDIFISENSEGLLPFIPYGVHFRKVRRWFQSGFQPRDLLRYHPDQVQEIHLVLGSLLDKPNDYGDYLRDLSLCSSKSPMAAESPVTTIYACPLRTNRCLYSLLRQGI